MATLLSKGNDMDIFEFIRAFAVSAALPNGVSRGGSGAYLTFKGGDYSATVKKDGKFTLYHYDTVADEEVPVVENRPLVEVKGRSYFGNETSPVLDFLVAASQRFNKGLFEEQFIENCQDRIPVAEGNEDFIDYDHGRITFPVEGMIESQLEETLNVLKRIATVKPSGEFSSPTVKGTVKFLKSGVGRYPWHIEIKYEDKVSFKQPVQARLAVMAGLVTASISPQDVHEYLYNEPRQAQRAMSGIGVKALKTRDYAVLVYDMDEDSDYPSIRIFNERGNILAVIYDADDNAMWEGKFELVLQGRANNGFKKSRLNKFLQQIK